MGFKKQIKGLDEDQIKLFIKRAIVDGTSNKILKSKSLKKSEYLQQVVLEATDEVDTLIDSLKETFDSPKEVLKYLHKSLRK
jgi:hypothetical protein